VEALEIGNLFGGAYRQRKVLVTGHTGFKGSWLALWLTQLGADVIGCALPPATSPNHWELLGLDMVSELSDIRAVGPLAALLQKESPEVVFHLAAQPLVRRSYLDPIETFSTNVMGLVNLLEACRQTPSVRAVVVVTSDKCYENREHNLGYVEDNALGGHDPYSASKGCAEIVTSSYRRSFFNKGHDTPAALVASARAGNAIGGGDWSEDRLIPDAVRAVVVGKPIVLRYPKATRPWQHVLESLSGYLMLGQKLLEGREEFAEAWNFGPGKESSRGVEEVIRMLRKSWEEVRCESSEAGELHEANLLQLDCTKARKKLH
jgi:CDP-glucose 4,6-dehydratase